jgi:succinate dehydrogenase/fumarate reductase flavoprotein subunit
VGLRKLEEIRARDLQGMATVSKDEVFNMEWADALEAQNMVDVAEMVCRAALVREESRGLHQRGDFPNSGPAWLRHILIEKTGRAMKFSTVPVEFPLITPE